MKKIVFYLVFFLMFVFGGTLNYFGILWYKMIFGALLPIVLLPFVRIRNNRFLYLTIAFSIVIIISAVVNGTEFLLVFWFFQNVLIPFLMYYIVVSYLTESNIVRVYRWIVLIACVQLPVIILQRIFYPVFAPFAKIQVADYDIGFGTFYTSDDTALSFFLVGVLLFLLFDEAHNHIIKNRGAVQIWLTFTIVMMNSKISYLILALIWAYYMISRRKIRTILYLSTVGVVVCLLVYFFGPRQQIEENYQGLKQQLTFNLNPKKAEIFFKTAQGNRPAALLYLSTQPPKIIGEGPHALYDPITNHFNMGGDTSQLITFYVDIGILGWLISYFMAYSIIQSLQKSEFTKLYFIVLCFISAVSNIFLDASIMMVFVIFCSSYLIPQDAGNALELEKTE